MKENWMMRNIVLLLLALVVPAEGALLVGTDLPPVKSSLTVQSCCIVAQPFTLTTGVQVSDIRVQVAGFGTALFTMWLTNTLGPGTGVPNVLFQTNFVVPNTGSGIIGATVSTSTNLSLAPGGYFLILSTTQSVNPDGWLLSGATL